MSFASSNGLRQAKPAVAEITGVRIVIDRPAQGGARMHGTLVLHVHAVVEFDAHRPT